MRSDEVKTGDSDSSSKRMKTLATASSELPTSEAIQPASSDGPIDVDALVEEVLREDVREIGLDSPLSPLEVDLDQDEAAFQEVEEYTSDSLSSEAENVLSLGQDGDGVWEEEAMLSPAEAEGYSTSEEYLDYTPLPEGEDPVPWGDAHEIIHEIMTLGPNLFVSQQIKSAQSPERVLEALGYPLPEGLLRADYFGKWGFVRRFLLKHVYERPRLGVSSLDDAVRLISNAQRILVLTGAGISVSCGIPDFRSEGGLYERVQVEYALPEPECMFDIEYFRIDPEPFFSFAKELLPNEAFKPSFSHYFIRNLEQRGKLLCQFTQNIDTLEVSAGIENVVFCHGSFATATCLQCEKKYSFDQFRVLLSHRIPECDKCEGVVKPDIVFFGESLPKEFDDHLATDCHETDLVLVIGSSLKVHPVSSIPDLIPPYVPQILINRESLDHNFDIELLGDCDVILTELFQRLGWQFPDGEVQSRFAAQLAAAIPEPSFIEPNYHIFPGAKLPSSEGQPPRTSGCSPVSSEGLVGEAITSQDEGDYCSEPDLNDYQVVDGDEFSQP